MVEPPATAPAPVLPPRPNLGPELLPEPQRSSIVWILVALAVGAGVILLGVFLRRRRRRNGTVEASSSGSFPETPQVLAAEEIRRAIIDRFGLEYKARTTEELRDDPRLMEGIGAEALADAAVIMGAADVEKFGGKVAENPDVEALAQRLSVLLATIRAGAISSRSGR